MGGLLVATMLTLFFLPAPAGLHDGKDVNEMNSDRCLHPVAFSDLIEYWLGELEKTAEPVIEEHLLGCAACSARLEGIAALGEGIRRAFQEGMVGAFITSPFLNHLVDRGMRVREYHVPRNGSVNCFVAPGDEVVVGRLQGSLSGVTRLDVVEENTVDEGERVFQDIPFDAASGEVIFAAKVKRLRAMPAHQRRMRLVAVVESGNRTIGEYTFNHQPVEPRK